MSAWDLVAAFATVLTLAGIFIALHATSYLMGFNAGKEAERKKKERKP